VWLQGSRASRFRSRIQILKHRYVPNDQRVVSTIASFSPTSRRVSKLAFSLFANRQYRKSSSRSIERFSVFMRVALANGTLRAEELHSMVWRSLNVVTLSTSFLAPLFEFPPRARPKQTLLSAEACHRFREHLCSLLLLLALKRGARDDERVEQHFQGTYRFLIPSNSLSRRDEK
jgi:hypothetical protein